MLDDIHRPFVNGRDSESVPSFVLSLQDVATFINSFAGGETLNIPLKPKDNYAVFLPQAGGNFLISNETPIPVVPSQGTGTPMLQANVIQNPAVVNLKESGFTDFLYISTTQAQTITVLIYSGESP